MDLANFRKNKFFYPGAARQNDRRVYAAADGVFFKATKMHCKGVFFEKCTVRIRISIKNLTEINQS